MSNEEHAADAAESNEILTKNKSTQVHRKPQKF